MTAPAIVEQAHIIDDLTRDVADLTRDRREVRDLLNDALAALRAGDLDVVGEFLDRSLTRLH